MIREGEGKISGLTGEGHQTTTIWGGGQFGRVNLDGSNGEFQRLQRSIDPFYPNVDPPLHGSTIELLVGKLDETGLVDI